MNRNQIKRIIIVLLLSFLRFRVNDDRFGVANFIFNDLRYSHLLTSHLSLLGRSSAALLAYFLLANPAEGYPTDIHSTEQIQTLENNSERETDFSGIHNNQHDLWSLTHPDLKVKKPSRLTQLLQIGKNILEHIRRGKDRLEGFIGKIFNSAYSRADDIAAKRAEMARLKSARRRVKVNRRQKGETEVEVPH
jgi:hypothetical protein